MESILQQALLRYHQVTELAWAHLLQVWPRLANYNPFELFILLNLIVMGAFIILNLLAKLSPVAAYKRILRGIFAMGPIRGKVQAEIDKAKKEILAMYP